jgi:hypothetical protein
MVRKQCCGKIAAPGDTPILKSRPTNLRLHVFEGNAFPLAGTWSPAPPFGGDTPQRPESESADKFP